MPTDADFLAAVAANPSDRLPRLVYADWLDERNDTRGELIRLEEETRERVAWDDVLWKLKPRRNELRRQTDADWLKAMDYGQSCEPLFRGQPFPTDVRDAWRLIREAHERWTGESMPDAGGHQDKVAEAEKRLGMTLPASVREYIAFAHDLPQREQLPLGWLRVYREWYSMLVVPVQPALSVLRLYEGNIHWAVRFEDLHRDDPPIYGYDWQRDETGEHEGGIFFPTDRPPTDSLSQFIFWQAHTYCDFVTAGHAGGMSAGVQDVEQAESQLREQFSFHSQFGGAIYYETKNYSAWVQIPGGRGALADVIVRPCRPMTEDQMPECVREWFRSGAPCNGYFGDLRYGYVRGVPPRATPIEYSPPPPPADHTTPEEPWPDDIPF